MSDRNIFTRETFFFMIVFETMSIDDVKDSLLLMIDYMLIEPTHHP
ncbi:hypothetical protein PPL_01196 [Heterostelium album PN500]|uniref:Transposase n=1 Tax=Heterostelium pallidum (strain ATCC 26659 / Pp 5 / PN500) TaxID=670386 RepID=D3AYD6_HETP5|nr:hypothetical protein PPL_01196 [Heterostelium album PN500]EFA85963.1 hypothetical protein PPL_01196 [Heterostelium album PN500]|eukprot:XP_020438069.1 hypothetical protein PPL_01196 [Heterostelium album PN500]